MARKTPTVGTEALSKAMIAFFCIVGLNMSPVFASGPGVLVERTVAASLTAITVSGSNLPEIRSITFTCAYSVPHASIMNAIVSSPQPKTVLSVMVDTAVSSLSIAVRAASTILIANGTPILTIRMSGESNQDWPLTVIKAIVVDKQGLSSPLPISLNASLVQNSRPGAADAVDRLSAQAMEAASVYFDAGGRKISGLTRRYATGYYLNNLDKQSGKTHFLIR